MMMRSDVPALMPLVPHPANASGDYRVDVGLGFGDDGRWQLTYAVAGAIGELVLPMSKGGGGGRNGGGATPLRRDGLWQASCFELFVRTGARGYHEWNFAPHGDFALYAFDDYRTPVTPPPPTVPPVIIADAPDPDRSFTCRVSVDVAPFAGDGVLSVGISAVMERADGGRDYWALAHPPGPPDFHAPACFAATILPPA
ncbi:DOMON-like domain-containing protein [Croceicoccus sp. F390]|uniref:DOMON-like domain-containing protein n=1 Tax=Croceicoccus esteveae TaxID=3075597 RepID=A0ABU2ZED7_9SPHN|nr:DOMON-like domain-containing protein [Croceicoccus sp. F390]MDT0574962.1 DOMON-like domain-containing protein [Croceicoccus sp. F390]